MMFHLWQGHKIIKHYILFSLELYLQNLIHSSYVSFLQRLENQFVQAAVKKPICSSSEDESQQTSKVREKQTKSKRKITLIFNLINPYLFKWMNKHIAFHLFYFTSPVQLKNCGKGIEK